MISRSLRRFFSTATEQQCRLTKLTDKYEGVALIELNNPQSKNSLSSQLITDLNNIIDETKVDHSIRCAIIRSSTPKMFCSGADLKARLQYTNEEVEDLVQGLRTTFDRVYQLPFPTIAAIDGFALGGGLELGLACDMRLATQKALIGLPETGLAIIPGAGGTQRLSRVIGIAKAKELVFTAARLSAQEALELGILNYVSEDYDAMHEKCLDLCSKILRNGPIGVRAAKAAMNAGSEVDIQSGLEIERLNYSRVAHSEDRIEGIKAFIEKRKPVYKGK